MILSIFLAAAPLAFSQKMTKEAQLAKAATENNLEQVKHLVKKEAADVNAQLTINEHMVLPLIIKTVMDDQTEISKFLIEEGANINNPDSFGMTCLMWAAYNGNVELVKFLLSKGADTGAETENGMTALKAAREQGHQQIVELLTKKK